MSSTARYDARAVRDALLKRGGPTEAGFICCAYRPFDNRLLYWEAETKLLDEKRSRLQAACVQWKSLACFSEQSTPRLITPTSYFGLRRP